MNTIDVTFIYLFFFQILYGRINIYMLLIIVKGNIIKFIRALLINNQSFGMIRQSHLSILLIAF